jgi:hypothetical protein
MTERVNNCRKGLGRIWYEDREEKTVEKFDAANQNDHDANFWAW